ncbi:PREDICTED: myb-like protein X isoform X1 [Polistes canadensis]|uniref:myb-like protein X isoform X1 n=1 Tax=Polistes canadensis TaxID=91411 RepID=UPI000718EDB4|nr:PREDICTED: myb-like protein X isoform X1 [Polistes canadensis]
MIDICTFFEYTRNVFPGKMVTIIQRKNLLYTSCLFLLLYSFILAVSGSYDYSTSEVFDAGEFAGDNEYLSNHRRNLLKRNYVSSNTRITIKLNWSKSRSTLEENSAGEEDEEEEETEKTNQKIQRKWKSQRKRKFKRFAVPESIGKNAATSTINSTEDFFNATNNTSTKAATNEAGGESLKITNSRNERNNSLTNVMNLKQENKTSEKREEQSPEILGFRRMAPLASVNFGRKIRGKSLKRKILTKHLPEVDFTIAEKKILKDLLHQIDHHMSRSKKIKQNRMKEEEKEEKEGDVPFSEEDKDKENENEESKKEYETDVKNLGTVKEDEVKKIDEKEGRNNKEEEKENVINDEDFEKSEENNSNTSIVSSSLDTELFEIIPDVFLPKENNGIIEGTIFPWKALTSKKYTKEVSMQEGPHKKQTTKETKSKLSFLYVTDPNTKPKSKEKLDNPLEVYDSKMLSKNREKDNKIVPYESIEQNVFDNNDIDLNNTIYGMLDTNPPRYLTKILHLDLF